MYLENIEDEYYAFKSLVIDAIAEELKSSKEIDLEDVKIVTENYYPELDQDYIILTYTKISVNKDDDIIVHIQDYMQEWDYELSYLPLDDVLKIYEAI